MTYATPHHLLVKHSGLQVFLINDRKHFVHLEHFFSKLVFNDDKRRCHDNHILVRIRHKLTCLQLTNNLSHDTFWIKTELNKWFVCSLILHQLYCREESNVSNISNALVVFLQLLKHLAKFLSNLLNVSFDFVVIVELHASKSCCTCKWMSTVRKAT